ncbi:class I SAM-dependent methyltransferase [Streptomyces albireticuli]|nr:class I SAM-dependent methyltransferase [Streptomyces albireticuli]MCD9145413.1 class I SAM-dependent methyltransferase [Streptomyces albireticuli]MCD9165022.1 class I SAM-dependent methyltransferase [Streptomyces albireticuli]MCD9195387.1 class I SAM-dependent methyltransferase [Streptomyces albireticuli]
MDPLLSNLLYDHPELYEEIYPDTETDIPGMCRRLFAEHGAPAPGTLLDIGCGTGRHLEYFTGAGYDCVGVDYQEPMVAFARGRRPGLDFRAGDMRTLRLGRTFTAVTCLGWALSNVHSNADLHRATETFAAHSAPGTLLFLHVPNAIATPEGHAFQQRFSIDTPGFRATAEADYRLDRRNQLLVRTRDWRIPGRAPLRDHVRFRLLFPKELEGYLTAHGFTVLAMYDNTAAAASELTGEALYVLARFDGTGAAARP